MTKATTLSNDRDSIFLWKNPKEDSNWKILKEVKNFEGGN